MYEQLTPGEWLTLSDGFGMEEVTFAFALSLMPIG